jgi:hypothetical protein
MRTVDIAEDAQRFQCGLMMPNRQLIRVLDPVLSLLPGVTHRK